METTIHFIALAIQRSPPTPSEVTRLLPALERLVDTLSQTARIPLMFAASPRPQYSDIIAIQAAPRDSHNAPHDSHHSIDSPKSATTPLIVLIPDHETTEISLLPLLPLLPLPPLPPLQPLPLPLPVARVPSTPKRKLDMMMATTTPTASTTMDSGSAKSLKLRMAAGQL